MFKVGDIVDGHIICLKALVGSHNYNLNTPESDRDYKYFVWPTFDDLYYNKEYHKEVVTEEEDYTIHDIRKLPSLLWKANLNFIEILYSRELTGNTQLLSYIKQHKEELGTMNLPRLYAAAMGMSYEKEKLMTKDSPARHEAIEKFGFDPKSAHHALRVVDFLIRYKKSGSIADSFWYKDGSGNYLSLVKKGSFTLEEINESLDNLRNTVVVTCENFFTNTKQNNEVLNSFNKFIKTAIYAMIKTSSYEEIITTCTL